MSIHQVGRGRAAGLASTDFSPKQAVQQANKMVMLQRAGAELANAVKSLQSVSPQRMQASQTVVERVKMTFWNKLGQTAAKLTALNVRSHQTKSHILLSEEIATRKKSLVDEMARSSSNKIESFLSVRANRKDDPAAAITYTKYLKFADLDNPEMSAFLNAMDDLRAAPTVKKAEAILRDFIVPAKTNEHGVPLEGQSTMQINCVSDKARNALMEAASHSIVEAHFYDTPGKLADMVKTFEDTEKYIATQLARNCTFQTEVNSAFNKLQTSNMSATRFDPGLKA